MNLYESRNDLSFCRIDGHVVFLDVGHDRYFRLSSRLEAAFEAHLEGAEVSKPDLAHLVEQGVLHRASAPAQWERHQVATAMRSALELPSAPSRVGPRLVLDVCAVVFRTHRWLKARRLKALLAPLTQRTRSAAVAAEGELTAATRQFLAARKFVPIETCCLLDSISLLTFLARRDLSAHMVIGVTHDPFTAHCWVQAQDLILNDALGNTRAFSVIRVV